MTTFAVATAMQFDGTAGASRVAPTVTSWGRRSVFPDRSPGATIVWDYRIIIDLGLLEYRFWSRKASPSVGAAVASLLGSLHNNRWDLQGEDAFIARGPPA